MPLALVTIAVFLILVGIKGNYKDVGQQFESDFMGQGGFFNFLVGIVGIAIFFRLLGLPNAGRVFLILVLLVYFMQNQNVLKAFQNLSAGSSNSGGSSNAGTATTETTTTPVAP